MEQQLGVNCNNPKIILVRPQLGENIGATARIMHNFGFKELRIVDPRDGWPNNAAINMAVGAVHILENSKIYSKIEDAIADVNQVFALTVRERYMNKPSIYTEQLSSTKITSKSAFIFGPERSGLSNSEVSFADNIITIMTNPDFTSINLAQSVAIICYELTRDNNKLPVADIDYELADQQQISSFLNELEIMLDDNGFFQTLEKKPGMIINIRNIFKRINPLTKQDIHTLYGIIKSINRKNSN
jgi:tRNA/rRNA methyltransferase